MMLAFRLFLLCFLAPRGAARVPGSWAGVPGSWAGVSELVASPLVRCSFLQGLGHVGAIVICFVSNRM